MNIQIITSSYPAAPHDPSGTAGLFVRENVANIFAHGRGEMSPATSDQKLAPASCPPPSPAAPKA